MKARFEVLPRRWRPTWLVARQRWRGTAHNELSPTVPLLRNRRYPLETSRKPIFADTRGLGTDTCLSRQSQFTLTITAWVPQSDCAMCAVSPLCSVTYMPMGTTAASTSRIKIFGRNSYHHLRWSLGGNQIRSVRFPC